MKILDQVRLVIYRCHEKGLEVFLIQPDLHTNPEIWSIPSGSYLELENNNFSLIKLDDTENGEGDTLTTLAIEADWHEIPSIRKILKHDANRVKNKIKETLPCLEQGTYLSVKEAVKKVMPQEYAALKELKDILLDRNLVTNF